MAAGFVIRAAARMTHRGASYAEYAPRQRDNLRVVSIRLSAAELERLDREAAELTTEARARGIDPGRPKYGFGRADVLRALWQDVDERDGDGG